MNGEQCGGNMRADRKEQRVGIRRKRVRGAWLADAKRDQPATDIGMKDGRIVAIAPQGRGFK
jgi:hypothetical protein